MSDFRLQIVHASTGDVVTWRPGFPIETEIVDVLCERLQKRGVGLFRREASVLAAVKEEFSSILWDLKSKV